MPGRKTLMSEKAQKRGAEESEMATTINDWNTRLREAASSQRLVHFNDRSTTARWWWSQVDQDCGPFSSLESCLQDARAHARRWQSVSIGYRPSRGYAPARQRRNMALERVEYHFDAYDRLVPRLPESRALPRVLLPAAQR